MFEPLYRLHRNNTQVGKRGPGRGPQGKGGENRLSPLGCQDYRGFQLHGGPSGDGRPLEGCRGGDKGAAKAAERAVEKRWGKTQTGPPIRPLASLRPQRNCPRQVSESRFDSTRDPCPNVALVERGDIKLVLTAGMSRGRGGVVWRNPVAFFC